MTPPDARPGGPITDVPDLRGPRPAGAVHHDQDNTVGAPRVTAELNDGVGAGERVNHRRVARVMRLAGIRGYQRRRKVRTTIPEPADAKVADLLKRDFTAGAPNRAYVGDS